MNGFEEAYEASGYARNGHPPETFTAVDLMALDLPPVREVVPDVLPEGVSLLAGKPKLGKSWLALGLCIAVAAGGVALGTKPVERGESLYLGLEDNHRRLQARLKKMLAGEPEPEGLHFATSWPKLSENGVEALREWLEWHPGTRLIVVDTLQKVRAPARSQNVYSDDYQALEKLLPVAAEHGVAIMVVHHLRKSGADDPLDEISGSTGLTGGVDGILVLKRDRGRGDAYLHVDGRDVEEPGELALTWNPANASWTIAGDADEYRMSQERSAVLTVLEDAGTPMTPTEIADALEKSVGSIKKLAWTMSRDGQINADNGKYSPLVTGNPVTRVRETSAGKENSEQKQIVDGGTQFGNRNGEQKTLRNEHPDKPVTQVTKVTGYPEEQDTGEQSKFMPQGCDEREEF